MARWTIVGEVDPAELGSYKSTTVAHVDPPAASAVPDLKPAEASTPGGDWQLVGVVGGTEEDMAEVRKAGNVFARVQAKNQERARFDLPPITAKDLPDRSGFLGGVSEFAHGVYTGIADRLPEDLARIWRGFKGDQDLKVDTWADRVIEENRRDRAMRLPSRQYAAGDMVATSLYEGPQNFMSSTAAGFGGAAIGTPGGPIGQAIGAATLSGTASYFRAKDQFIERVLEQAQAANINLTPAQVEQIKRDIDWEATKVGWWEAGPEALLSAFTAGLLNGVGGTILAKVPGLKQMIGGMAKNALVKTVAGNEAAKQAAKYAADVGLEELAAGITYFGQAGVEKDVGLRRTDPSLREFIDTQAGQVAVGATFQRGADAGLNRLAQGWRRPAAAVEQQPQPTRAQPEQPHAQPQPLPANPAPFATSSELGLEPGTTDFAGTPTIPQLTPEQVIAAFHQGVRSDTEALSRKWREEHQHRMRELDTPERRQELEHQRIMRALEDERSRLEIPGLNLRTKQLLSGREVRPFLPAPWSAEELTAGRFLPEGPRIEPIGGPDPVGQAVVQPELGRALPDGSVMLGPEHSGALQRGTQQAQPVYMDHRQDFSRRKPGGGRPPQEQAPGAQGAPDLPDHIRQAYPAWGGGPVEPAPVPRKAYSVADRPALPERAAAPGMHEQEPRLGLRGLFANDQRFANILDYVSHSMPRKDLREIRHAHGLKADKEGRLVAAEAYLAGIADKVRAGDALTQQERRWWLKVQDAFKRLPGRASALSELEMAEGVVDSVRRTLAGRPTGRAPSRQAQDAAGKQARHPATSTQRH